MIVTAATHHGKRFDVSGLPNNEDRFLVLPERGLVVLADGMGGHDAGAVAAEIAIDEVARMYAEHPSPVATVRFAAALKGANAAVIKGQSRRGCRDMGTTCVALALEQPDLALMGHVGDSRCYRLRGATLTQSNGTLSSSSATLTRLTTDHSLVQEYLDIMGARATPEGLAEIPSNVVTRSLGRLGVNGTAALGRTTWEPGDAFMLCSDGLWGTVNDAVIAATILQGGDAQALVDVALAANHPRQDNVTVVLVRL